MSASVESCEVIESQEKEAAEEKEREVKGCPRCRVDGECWGGELFRDYGLLPMSVSRDAPRVMLASSNSCRIPVA